MLVHRHHATDRGTRGGNAGFLTVLLFSIGQTLPSFPASMVGGQTGPTCLAVKEADLDGLSAGPALGPFLLSVKATPIVRSPALEEAAQANISGDESPGFIHLDQPPDRV
jgi:hypothetical protein